MQNRWGSCFYCSLSLLKFRMQCTLDLITYWWFLNMWTAPIYCGACFIELHELSCGAGWYKYAHTQTKKTWPQYCRASDNRYTNVVNIIDDIVVLGDSNEHRVMPFHDWRTPYSIHLSCTICSVLFCASLHRGLKICAREEVCHGNELRSCIYEPCVSEVFLMFWALQSPCEIV